jgi:NitT/TauT family transport system substrate-binding protein
MGGLLRLGSSGWWRLGVLLLAALLALPAPTPAGGRVGATPALADAVLAAPTESGAPAVQALTPVRVGMQYIISDAGVLIPHDWGYFRELGLDVQLNRMDNIELQTAMASGAVEVGGVGPTAALNNAFLRGVRLKIVADRGTLAPGHGYLALVVRKDLVDSGQVRSLADLRGLTVSPQPPLYATPGWYLVTKLLESAGINESDVRWEPLGFADQTAALAGRTIDVAWQPEPGVAATVDRGLGVRFAGGDEAIGSFTLGGLAYSEQFATQTDPARRFMIGYLRGVRAYLDAFTKNQGKADVVRVLAQHTGITDPAVYDRMHVPYMNPDGAFSTYAYEDVQRYFIQHGVQPSIVNMDQIVDNSFANYAAAQLGPYR